MHSVSLNVSQLFFTPNVGTWLHVELCQTDRSVSVLLTTKVMTVYCIGTVRKKVFIFFNFEMNKSTTAEKIQFSKFQLFYFLSYSGIFGGDSVKQLNKFVWPYDNKRILADISVLLILAIIKIW